MMSGTQSQGKEAQCRKIHKSMESEDTDTSRIVMEGQKNCESSVIT